MCGIAGLIAARPVNRAAVAAMAALQAHRGPDDSGEWASDDGRVAFGHRRLAVIDPTAAGRQPMLSADGRHVLVFNGEIYNHLEIADRLAAEGVRLRSRCDTEVLLEALRRWGPKALDSLNGMFAFALWDDAAKTLLCARDRFGEKPFLYAQGSGFFAFASEYKALLALREIPLRIDRLRLARFLHRPSVALDDDADTVFTGIRQLRPGEMLRLDMRSLQPVTERYWTATPDGDAAHLSEADAAVRFRELLTDSVRLRMRADVPQGSCLSGGLDSGAIVCLARRLIGEAAPYHVFTGRFPGTAADEWRYARTVVEATGASAHCVAPTPEGFVAELPAFMWHNELPVGSTSQYAQWCVFRLAHETGVTVLLDGQGADEMLGGYEQFFRLYLAERRACGDGIAAEMHAIRERYPLALPGRREAASRALPAGLRRSLARRFGRGSDAVFGMTGEIAGAVAAAERRRSPDITLADAFRRESFVEHLPVLLRYGDRNSMAHSREVRLPFCDHRLAEFALGLPARHHMGGAQTKRLLREAMRGILPEPVRTRWNKQGFVPPQAQWLRGPLMRLAEDTVANEAFGQEGLWDPAWWRAALRRFRAGDEALAATLWRPMIEASWRRHFVDRMRALPKQSAFAAA
jgi:asparagine synthase (glutamine-hydrolysing)